MLSYQLLNNHAGILLIGDYTSLRSLHEVVHDVHDRSPLIKEKDGPFLALAYDVRKAYEQQREIVSQPEHHEEMGVRYGVQILWPVLLLQQRMLRVSLGYIDHSRKHQAITYALEAAIEDGLKEDFDRQGPAIIEQWQRLDPINTNMFDKLRSRGAIFCSWSKAQRKQHFANLLSSFDSMYESAYAFRVKNGQKDLLDPEELGQWANSEWPDPRW